MKIDLQELTEVGILSQEKADQIRRFYAEGRGRDSSSVMRTVFAVVGAVLVGLGIISIIAHNWDQLGKGIRIGLAYLPVIVCLLLCWRWRDGSGATTAKREAAAAALVLAVGAMLALISQTLQIQGEVWSYLATWIGLAMWVPILMRSAASSLILAVLMVYYAGVAVQQVPLMGRWPLAAAAIAIVFYRYYLLPDHNSRTWTKRLLDTLLPLAWVWTIATLLSSGSAATISLLLLVLTSMYLHGEALSCQDQRFPVNGYMAVGSAGVAIVIFILSFDALWDKSLTDLELPYAEMLVLLLAVVILVTLLVQHYRSQPMSFKAVHWIWVVPVALLASVDQGAVASLIMSLLLLAWAAFLIYRGVGETSFLVLNYGLILFGAFIIARFADTSLSFTVKGLLFVVLGISFFVANSYLARQKRIQ